MHRLKMTLLVAVALMQPGLLAHGRESRPARGLVAVQRDEADGPPEHRTTRPRLSLQAALAKADEYLQANRINVSHYYLFQVRFILYGDKERKTPGWHVWWVHESGAAGKYIELFVDMDGNVGTLPSL